MSVKVDCPRCGTHADAGKKCHDCGLMLDGSQIKVSQQDIELAEKKSKSYKTVKGCASCHEVKTIISRGLCGTCRSREKAAETLDENYPAKHRGGFAAKTSTIKPVVDQKNENINSKTAPVTPISRVSIVSAADIAATGGLVIVLRCSDREKQMLSDLQLWADDDRRTLDNQAMFLLEQTVANRQQNSQ